MTTRVVILGAGVVGVTSAYYLARAGASVTVLDRRPAAAMETSFANAGQISPGYSTPWAAPGIPLKALRWMFERDAPLSIRPDGSLFQVRWIIDMLLQCTATRYAINKERMMRLAGYSRDRLRALRQETGIEYDARSGGTLQLFRSSKQVDAAQHDIAVLRECGVDFELLEPGQLAAVEPALADARQLAGGLRLPGDETGDCHLFTRRLAALAERLGVQFQYETTVEGLVAERGRVTGVVTDAGTHRADTFVVAGGSCSRDLLGPLGIRLPVYPVKGYSLTLPIVDESRAPRSTVLDETYKIAVTRLGSRIRVGGMAELCGDDLRLDPRRRATLEKVVTDLFPGGDLAAATFWAGLRPMTPDGTPIIGRTALDNLFVNTGHGTLGWTMACGSGKLLSDLVTGKPPEIRFDDLGLDRGTRVPGPDLRPSYPFSPHAFQSPW